MKRPSLLSSLSSLLSRLSSRFARFAAVRAVDDPRDRMLTGRANSEGWRDRYGYDRDYVLSEALKAWRENPLAKRIVGLTTQYVVGGGVTVESKHARTNKFVEQLWDHRLNRMTVRLAEWCDELTRAGNLFIVLSTGVDGMSFVRALPADNIDRIESQPNDIEQIARVIEKQNFDEPTARTWDAYDEATDQVGPEGQFKPVILHYAINRPVAAQWGESDLAPLLKWLSRFTGWLEDRVRLNHWRQVFMFIVRGVFASPAERQARQNELNAQQPANGSILVTDSTEAWGTLSANLDSFDAGQDGLAIKKVIGAGAAVPMHFIGEPEGSTRTTAEAAGGPTYRHYQQRQIFFLWMVTDLLKVAIRRRSLVDQKVKPDAKLNVRGTDISARDNASLAVAATQIVGAFTQLYDRGIVDEEELIRLTYTFAGELVDVEELLEKVVPPRTVVKTAPPPNAPAPVDTATGDVGGAAALQSPPGRGGSIELAEELDRLVAEVTAPIHAPSPGRNGNGHHPAPCGCDEDNS